jgi:hypothetical protein
MLCAIRRIAIAVFPKPKLLRWLAIVRSPNIFSVLFVLIACIGIIYSNSNVLFVDFTMPKGDMASNDILRVEAKHFRLFHGHYSLFSFYHPGPIYFQWMALFEWLFVDVFRVFISPQAAHYFSIIVLHVVAFALYLRLWLLWSGSMTISIAALIVTNAVPFTIIGRNYVVSTWPADFYLASSLIVVTGLIGIATRGPSWLPLLVFGLAQLVHGHASFIGLVPIMIVTAATVAWMGGRLPDQIYRVDNAIAYVKSHPLPFIISAAIAVLLTLPMIINTIWAWPGEFPKYFRFPLRNNSFIAAINYVISFMPMNGLWTLLFLLPPRKFTNAGPAATDYHFVGLLILATAGVPALFYAYRGVYDFGASYLLYWILPFIGAALATAILYFASVFSFGWLRFGLVTLSAVWSLKGYRARTVLYHDTRSPALTAAAVEMLSSRAVSGEKIVLQLERGVAGWRMVWWETVSILGAMKRSNAHFLCVAPNSWHLVCLRRPRSFEQNFRVDMWNVCRGYAATRNGSFVK